MVGLVGTLPTHMQPMLGDSMLVVAHLSPTQDVRQTHMRPMKDVHQRGTSRHVPLILILTVVKPLRGTQVRVHRIPTQTVGRRQHGMQVLGHQTLTLVVEALRAPGVVPPLEGMWRQQEVRQVGEVLRLAEQTLHGE